MEKRDEDVLKQLAATQNELPAPPPETEVVQPGPVIDGSHILTTLVTLVGVAVAGALLFPYGCPFTRTCGATRSARIQWQQRQTQVEREIAEIETASPQDGTQ